MGISVRGVISLNLRSYVTSRQWFLPYPPPKAHAVVARMHEDRNCYIVLVWCRLYFRIIRCGVGILQHVWAEVQVPYDVIV